MNNLCQYKKCSSIVAPNEVKVIVHVIDENDNAPRFKTNGRPMVAAIPNTVSYGYIVTKIEVVISL